jgi:hypothetical protein
VTDAELEVLIRRRAHEMWERGGRPEGSALRHWLDAERRVREEVAYAAALRDGPAREPPGLGARPLSNGR